MTPRKQTMTAERMVKERIPGFRKGTEEPAYIHSLRVSDALRRHGFADEVVIAGLLHDIVEDGETTFDDLEAFGFSERVVALVRLCTHNDMIPGHDARWVRMLANLVDANDREAWAIKVADVTDNLRSCETLPPDRALFMRTVKAPLMLHLTERVLWDSSIWHELAREIKKAGA